jgi:hypothetical protein
MTMGTTYENFVRDTIRLLTDGANTARTEQRRAPTEFNRGRTLAYYEVLSTIKQEAITFGLHLRDLSLADMDPDRDLL